jgi:succinate-semialdehyde dehydrogenase/glutarate-semialdehyde dehydrogenase
MAQCAGRLKKLSLELGGNAPFIVFDDADLDAAVAGRDREQVSQHRQTCVCANRLLVQDGVYDAFVAKLVDAVRKLRVGDGLKGVDGPGPADRRTRRREGRGSTLRMHSRKGARVASGGKRHALGGTFFEPTVITQVKPDMLVAREEDVRTGRADLRVQGTKRTRCAWRTTPSSVSRRISTRAISRVRGAWRGARVRHRRA